MGVYNPGLCAQAQRLLGVSGSLMTTKKAAKSKSAAPRKSTATAKPKSNGLLGRLKGALSMKTTTKSASKSKPAKTKKAVKKMNPAAKSTVKKVAAEKAKAAPKPATRNVSKVAGAGRKAAPAAKKPITTKTADRPPAVVAPPSSSSHVTKSTTKKVRISTFDSNLTENDIKRMPDDDYMNDVQLEFFRRRLLQMRQEVLQREMDVKERLHEREVFADPADRATAEEEHWLDLRLRERESLLLRKVDDALRRIEAREYGYCEKTGDPIGIPRLLARPTATVCVDVKGQDERVEAQYRDR